MLVRMESILDGWSVLVRMGRSDAHLIHGRATLMRTEFMRLFFTTHTASFSVNEAAAPNVTAKASDPLSTKAFSYNEQLWTV